MVDLDDFRLFLVRRVANCIAAVRDDCCFSYHNWVRKFVILSFFNDAIPLDDDGGNGIYPCPHETLISEIAFYLLLCLALECAADLHEDLLHRQGCNRFLTHVPSGAVSAHV